MKKILFAALLVAMSTFSTFIAKAAPQDELERLIMEETEKFPDYSEQPSRQEEAEIKIKSNNDVAEIGVETNQLRFTTKGKTHIFRIATARRGDSTENIPYGKVFKISRIIFNPSYTPTEETKKEYFEKHRGRKKLKDVYFPGENGNALGFVKFYLYNENGKISSLGGHTTDSPNSIGKRVSHGCFRFSDKDGETFATLILLEDGYTIEEIREIIKQAKMHRHKSISIKVKNGPTAIYRRK